MAHGAHGSSVAAFRGTTAARVVGLALGLASAACGPSTPSTATVGGVAPTTAPPPGPSSTLAPGTPVAVALSGPTTSLDGGPPRRWAILRVTDVSGRTAEEMGSVFAPTQEALETCTPGSAGKVEIRVQKVGSTTHFHLEPGTSLDPVKRHCVLEALALSNVDDAPALNSGANVRPTGFTSVLTLSWQRLTARRTASGLRSPTSRGTAAEPAPALDRGAPRRSRSTPW